MKADMIEEERSLMLIINRSEDEIIIIDGVIEIKILRPPGHQNNPDFIKRVVRLGITAPKHISVHRKEVQDAINRERSLAGSLVQ